MKISKDKICLQSINMLMQLIFTFFTIFFTIYIYDMSKNLNFVLGYTLFSAVFFCFTEIITVKFLNKQNFNLIYRLSFLLSLISISLIFLINDSTIYMVFVVQAVYAIARVFYYLPQEVATMNYNTKKSMTSYVGVSLILELFAVILSPIISGYIIDRISYYVLFGIIGCLAIICFTLSFGVKQGYIERPNIKIKEYMIGTHKIKRIKTTYLAYGIYKFSQNSTIDLLLPLLLFLKVGTNFSVGIYSAIAAVASGLTLIIYLIINKKYKNFHNWSFIFSTILIEIVSIILVLWTNLVGFFIYYFVMKCCRQILSQNINQSIYTATENTEYSQYKKEHHMTFNLYDHIFKIFGYILTLLIYNFFQNTTTILIIILILSVFQILSTLLFVKADKMYELEQNESETQTNDSIILS